MINENRLAQIFSKLVSVDSISKDEKAIVEVLQTLLTPLKPARIITDRSSDQTGSNVGNLIALFNGKREVPPMLLCAHMDTVEPGRGVTPRLVNGKFTSDTPTILGADDKSGIAIILEFLHVIKENDLPHGPLEIVFTVCEEIGLIGAKHLEFKYLNAAFGYVLDFTEPYSLITNSPGANRLTFEIEGKSAHAGVCPEKGVSAIEIAAKAIASLPLGRIDHETTCNIGKIEGGTAINIIPDRVRVEGEARSHDAAKLESITQNIVQAFQKAVQDQGEAPHQPGLTHEVVAVFPVTCIDKDHPVVTLAKEAAQNLGATLNTLSSGGGFDANIFYKNGIVTGVLGTGMQDMHTKEESIMLEDMARTIKHLLEIMRLHAKTS